MVLEHRELLSYALLTDNDINLYLDLSSVWLAASYMGLPGKKVKEFTC